jgi:hypothetical protein
VLRFLNARRVRGRGGVGARQDEAGPFLPLPAAAVPARLPRGPPLPPQLQRAAAEPAAAKKARKHAATAAP